jgi:hypothetical protein
MRKVVLFALSCVVPGCLAAPPIDEQSSPIIGGTIDNGDPAVVLLIHDDADGRHSCTGSLIAPTVILTAGHCTDGPQPGPQDTYQAFFGTDGINLVGQLEKIVSVVPHPQYDGKSRDHDVGVMILANPVAVPPIAVNMKSVPQSMVGEETRLVGFGRADPAQSSRIKRQVISEVQRVEPNLLFIGAPGKQSCSGDSGGPAFLMQNGKEVIAATVSGGDPSCTKGGDHTRVDTQASFLSKYLVQAPPPPPPPPPVPPSEDGGAAVDAGQAVDGSQRPVLLPDEGPTPTARGCSVGGSARRGGDAMIVALLALLLAGAMWRRALRSR